MKMLMRLYFDPAADAGGAAPAAVIDPPPAAAVTPAPADLKPASVSTTVDINTPPVTPAAAESFVIPEAFKDKPYLKGAKSLDDVYKMLDGAQTLIGQKGPAIPKPEAPQEEWDKYYESIGRPKTAAEYNTVLTGADKTDAKVLPRLQGAFHKAGLRPDQAKIIWDESMAAFGDFAKDQGLAAQQADVDFEKLATDNFGIERDRVLARGKELIGANISPAMKPAVEKLDNNALIVLADVLRNIDKKYIKQDGPGTPPTILNGTPDELRSKARGLMSEQAKFDPMSVEFQNLQKQIDGIYDSLRKSGR